MKFLALNKINALFKSVNQMYAVFRSQNDKTLYTFIIKSFLNYVNFILRRGNLNAYMAENL